MVKKFIFVTFLTCCIFLAQIPAMADQTEGTGTAENRTTEDGTTVSADQTKTVAAITDTASTETVTKYAVEETNIYKEPNETSQVLDRTKRNTSFEVALEQDGWSMVTTSDGYAFIHSMYLAPEEVPQYDYSDEDLYVLAHLLAGEAQNCPDEEQLYVGSVALNRVAHSSFPNTIKGVVFQKGQYACTWDGNYYREPTQRNWANARKLLEGGSVLPANVVWQSGGKQGKGVYIKTRWHYYCY